MASGYATDAARTTPVKTPLSIQVLHSYYEVSATLREYLGRIIDTTSPLDALLTHETDSRQYCDLLSTCVVALPHENIRPTRFKLSEPLGPLRELICRAQRVLLLRGIPSENVLTCGYQLAKCTDGGPGGGRLLQSRFVNTVVTAFESPAWATLHQRLGDDIVFHLLVETSMFLTLPNACYCQLTGKPVVDLPAPPLVSEEACLATSSEDTKRKREDGKNHDMPAKRRKLGHRENRMDLSKVANPACSTAGLRHRTPSQIMIPRSRMFYFRSPLGDHSQKTSSALPPTHVLNRLPVLRVVVDGAPNADLRKQADNARHLAKHVFPRQYGLRSVFDIVEGSGPAAISPDYSAREEEIKNKGPSKTPKRVRPALELLEKIIWSHHKSSGTALLAKTCRSKVRHRAKPLLDSSAILELMSETSGELHSQAMRTDHTISFDSQCQPIPAGGLTQARQLAKQKPRFAEFMCGYSEVFAFAVSVTKAVIPMQLWGSSHNFKLMKRHIMTFISMRRHESFTLHTLVQGLQLDDCEWLFPPGASEAKQRNVPISDSLKRLELMQEFVFWYFDSFLIPLLKNNFYITESQAFKNKVLYFRQDDWELLCRPLMDRLCENTFQKLGRDDAEEILRQRRLGYSFVRLLPKETGVRPIINLRRRETKSGALPRGSSINQILKTAFQILTYEKDHQKGLLGASVFGPHETYKRLKAFKATLTQDYGSDTLPKLYFVKLDVQACFDTIDQTKLLRILHQLLSEDAYIVQRHGRVSAQTGRIRRDFVSTAMPADDYPHFFTLASKLADSLRSTIFVDKVVYPDAKRKEVIELLEQHITDNIVKIGSDYYRQVVGIPQGSILSTLLCSFFYGDLERSELKFTDDPHSVLCRLIDDYLFITTDRAKAKHFYEVMARGHPEYGCFISREKSLANFDEGGMENVIDPSQGGFPWCGMLIDMKTLCVSADYSRWSMSTLRDSLTVEAGRRPGAAFAQKMMVLARAKSHLIFNDCRLNTLHTVHRNIYQSFCLTAIRMHLYIRSWRPNMAKSSAFLTSTVRQTIRSTYATMRNKAISKLAKAYGARFDVPQAAVIWLGTHAFHTVLSRKSHEYAGILKSLEFDMRLPQYARQKRLLGRAVKEGREILATLDF